MTFEDIVKANGTIVTEPFKGKGYAQVNQRVKAFRMLYPNGTIDTAIISCKDGVVVMKATIADDAGNILATGHAYEKEGSTFVNQESYIENCETSCVGRALGFVGLGIDVSICSAEELKNAVVNQNPKIDKDSLKKLKGLAESKGVAISEICDRFGVDRLEDLHMKDFVSATIGLERTNK